MSTKDIAARMKELEEDGYIVKEGGSGHYKIYVQRGDVAIYVTSYPKTTRKHRSILNAETHLKRRMRELHLSKPVVYKKKRVRDGTRRPNRQRRQ